MKKSLATIAVSVVMITGLAPIAHAGPGNSDFGHAQQGEAHERRDARHEERKNRPTEPETPQEPQTPDTPDSPDTPDTPDNPDTPATPDTPGTPDTPDTPDTPGTPGTPNAPEDQGTAAPDSNSTQGVAREQLRGLGPAGGASTSFVKQFDDSPSSVIFLSVPKVVRHKDQMAINAFCVMNGKRAAGQEVTFTVQRMSKGKNPRLMGQPKVLGSRVTDDGEAEFTYRVRSKGQKKLATGRYQVSVTIEMADGSVETATKSLRVKKAKKK